MFNLVIILLSTINSEPKDSNNYKIAKYILENLSELENCTLTELAKQCYVSNSSISRFCKDIGLKDFNTLKNQLIRFSYVSKQAREKKFKFKETSSTSLSQSYINSVIDNLKHINYQALDKDINHLVTDIKQYDKVAAFGYLHSENVALNLQYDLRTNGKIIFTRLRFIDQIDYIHHCDEKTLLIIFSESGTYFNRVFQRMKPFASPQNKPKIYMVTANQTVNEPFIDYYIRYNSRDDYASHPYPLMTIADLICIAYGNSLDQCF